MFKLFVVLALCLALAASQSCATTSALRTTYNFTGYSTPQSLNNITYCKALIDATTCCPDSVVNNFQDGADELVDQLTTYIKVRDSSVADADDVEDDFKTAYTNLVTAVANFELFVNKTLAVNASNTTNSTNSTAQLEQIEDILGALVVQSGSTSTQFATLDNTFSEYQEDRADCIETALQLQAAVWCYACDPNAGTKGFTQGSGFNIDPTTCNRLQSSCYDFLANGQYQNTILAAQLAVAQIDAFTALINQITNGAAADDSDFDYEAETPLPAQVPAGCTSETSCPYICNGLFDPTTGQIDLTVLVLGGTPVDVAGVENNEEDTTGDEEGVRRRLGQRNLAGNTFNPAPDEAGISVSFPTDPAGTQSSGKFSTLSMGSVFVSVMVVISAIMF